MKKNIWVILLILGFFITLSVSIVEGILLIQNNKNHKIYNDSLLAVISEQSEVIDSLEQILLSPQSETVTPVPTNAPLPELSLNVDYIIKRADDICQVTPLENEDGYVTRDGMYVMSLVNVSKENRSCENIIDLLIFFDQEYEGLNFFFQQLNMSEEYFSVEGVDSLENAVIYNSGFSCNFIPLGYDIPCSIIFEDENGREYILELIFEEVVTSLRTTTPLSSTEIKPSITSTQPSLTTTPPSLTTTPPQPTQPSGTITATPAP